VDDQEQNTEVQEVPSGEAEQQPAASETKPEQVGQAEILKRLDSYEKQLRTFQSEKDRAVANESAALKQLAEETRKRKAAEATVKGLSSEYGDDPDFTGRLDSVQTRSKLQTYEEREAEERKQRELAEAQRKFVADLAADISDLGVDPKDDRLTEAAKGARDNRDLRSRLMKEALKIAKGEATGGKVKKDPEIERLETELANLKKAVGVGSDAFSSPSGIAGSSDADFLNKWNSGELPATKENIEKARKIISA